MSNIIIELLTFLIIDVRYKLKCAFHVRLLSSTFFYVILLMNSPYYFFLFRLFFYLKVNKIFELSTINLIAFVSSFWFLGIHILLFINYFFNNENSNLSVHFNQNSSRKILSMNFLTSLEDLLYWFLLVFIRVFFL